MLVFETTTTANPAEPHPPIGCQPDYFKSIPGILKIAELVLSIIVLICQSVAYTSGWVEFVAIKAIFVTIFLLIVYGINVRRRFTHWFAIIELVYYCLITAFYLIAAIISAVRAGHHSSIAATCFFCFVAVVLFGFDAYQQFRVYQTQQNTADAQAYKGAPTSAVDDPPPYETQRQY